ncbi:aminopeptidase putativemetallo-peptidase Clan MF Family M17 [Leptomonas pyrrhocoris]|uniref:Aminopeptidase putativemetallo-peptidase Clan MF Family M17 n=1 Tax=Leptomonas pyrrhocoris TaxID=157538 RepID=A0A0N0DVY9_LEPPY|nr:aminopeptidase putativemetallo-peptidase Clan MF Family M17 [Leptomonas pyrrhocoris]KPA81041.1 aminopeptidase putativemetallo-peptidase Clan MF Family M17 [Leptomonas pyrrhocoris]|eukprot:XP_015659480.1 aminopeptidase putativemetallo-peptidase Clan MF Family M17 [Leptomonas pyrrhocoris]
MSAYKRVRSSSKYEEANVSAFVDSCVDFTTNVAFHTVDEGKTLTAKEGRVQTVLVLGTDAQLREPAAAATCPFYDAAVAAAAAAAPEARAYVATASSKLRVLIGKVPSAASRHNCPARPDAIHEIVKQAVAQCPSDDESAGLDIYYLGSGYDLSVATAIARSCNQSFSAKKGLAEQGYLRAGRPVRAVIPSCKPAALAVVAHSVQLCQRLVNAPTSLLDTVTFAEIAVRWADKLRREGLDVSADVIAGEELRERGYGGLYGVGKAAEYPPQLVTLSYKPKAGISPKDRIALVGKGIVYDTGGLSIKSREGMCTMKHDMGGAAAVFCGLLALAQLGVPVEASSVLCMADNAVGPCAQRPDDIIRMKSGVTVEINNTDAEGRIVLSDGVYHASHELSYVPSIVVDMATLTGAQGIATGQRHAAIYTNTEGSESRFVQTGLVSGDLCFPVVYCPEFFNPEYSSAVADYRNSVKNRANAQVSCAAQFIGNNLAKDYKGEWVHVDLAGPATRDEATGFGVALIAQLYAPESF